MLPTDVGTSSTYQFIDNTFFMCIIPTEITFYGSSIPTLAVEVYTRIEQCPTIWAPDYVTVLSENLIQTFFRYIILNRY